LEQTQTVAGLFMDLLGNKRFEDAGSNGARDAEAIVSEGYTDPLAASKLIALDPDQDKAIFRFGMVLAGVFDQLLESEFYEGGINIGLVAGRVRFDLV